MTTVTLPNNWKPRPYQLNVWKYLERGGKRALPIWHRRAGKDDVALHWAAVSAHQRVGTYWHMLPEAAQARKAIWDAINPHTGLRRIDEAFPMEIRQTTREQDMMIRFKCGSTWQVVGSDNFNSLVGSPPVGVVFSEWALADPNAWAYLRPILAENGGWAFFITTPRGRNHVHRMVTTHKEDKDWFVEILDAKKSKAFTEDRLKNELREYKSEFGDIEGKARFEQEYMCSFDSAVPGAYYGHLIAEAERDNRIVRGLWDPKLSVHTGWDLGIDDATAIWFAQVAGGELHLIDYYETAGFGLDHYADLLRSKPYTYEDHYFPHDGAARELGTGKSRQEVMRGLGFPVKIVKQHRVEDGINAVRTALPKCWFDASIQDTGLNGLREYRRDWDDKLQTYKKNPRHDWASHGADALRTLAMGLNLSPTKQKTIQQWQQPDTKWVV